MLKIVYIGARGGHSKEINEATRGDKRFVCCGVAAGDADEDIKVYYGYIVKDHPEAKLYEDYLEMLDIEKPNVAVVSPKFGDTAKVCIECAKRGIHIMTEKPVATTRDDLTILKETVKENNVHLMAMHFLHYTGPYYEAICAVRQGKIGEVRMVNAQKSYKLYQRDDFYKKRESYGGTIPWVGVHALDWIYAIINKPCVKVSACQSTVGNNGHGDLETTCLCQYIFEEEVMASLQIDYLRPDFASTHSDDRLRIVGTKGVLEVREGKLHCITESVDTVTIPETKKDLVLEFLEEVLGGTKGELRPEDIFAVTELALAAQEAADNGGIVCF
ncbi:MAG: Gfo/Idh/MocA family oxidoreductase [Clostridia bacterium]|nr:Gfo/Idh/MocA family oxidoreductase [Clostridia bacterium]